MPDRTHGFHGALHCGPIMSAKPFHQTSSDNAAPVLRTVVRAGPQTIVRMWKRLASFGVDECLKSKIADPASIKNSALYNANIENMIGTVKIPVGVVGPLRVNGVYASGYYPVPLATTEAALVASYNRGAKTVNEAGGITAAALSQAVLRSPVFRFSNVREASLFAGWVYRHADRLKKIAQSTTSHGKPVILYALIDFELVYLLCGFETGDASGQNMVTFATEALCKDIIASCPFTPLSWYVEGNLSGDKKASFISILHGRGRKATAQVELSEELVEKNLSVSIPRLAEYIRIASLGAQMAGQIGAQAHYANGLAALFAATGQDIACVAESSVGFTRAEEVPAGIKFTVTLPNLMVGTVGGGTDLPSQKAGLELMGLKGEGKANAFAEVAAALILCGELSLVAAIASGKFGGAHQRLARKRRAP